MAPNSWHLLFLLDEGGSGDIDDFFLDLSVGELVVFLLPLVDEGVVPVLDHMVGPASLKFLHYVGPLGLLLLHHHHEDVVFLLGPL
jgi:hypothetical protein